MSRDSIENTEDNSQVELSSKEHDIPNLSDCAKNLQKNVKSRYLEKISLVRIGANLDPECLLPIEATDLLCYLVMDTSFYTKEQFKAFKSMEAYNQMVSGFITSVQGKIICDKFVVCGSREGATFAAHE